MANSDSPCGNSFPHKSSYLGQGFGTIEVSIAIGPCPHITWGDESPLEWSPASPHVQSQPPMVDRVIHCTNPKPRQTVTTHMWSSASTSGLGQPHIAWLGSTPTDISNINHVGLIRCHSQPPHQHGSPRICIDISCHMEWASPSPRPSLRVQITVTILPE